MIETMKQALEALEPMRNERDDTNIHRAITNLRAAIKAMEDVEPSKYSDIVSDGGFDLRDRHPAPVAPVKQEPVAWVDERAIAWLTMHPHRKITTTLEFQKSLERPMPLYTEPVAPEYKP